LDDSFLFRSLLPVSASTDAVATATVTQRVEQVDRGVLHTEKPFYTQPSDRPANLRRVYIALRFRFIALDREVFDSAQRRRTTRWCQSIHYNSGD
ncbi:uncharacterized, partial [Tachysurus ichikawai]